ncbi:MAG: cysteine desulfurase [Bacilli bacterium]|nr:cysteine desulfurase [Bacilli bacterium]
MVYLDYSATTPVLPEVLDSYNKVSSEYFGNSNSLHNLGIKSRELLESASKQVSELLNVGIDEITFTSGATESNNIALIGACLANKAKGNHIIVSKLEHPSIYAIVDYLVSIGFKVSYVNNTEEGVIDFEDLKRKMNEDTILVSICAVNSETGVRQPLKTIKQVINKFNSDILLHSDITQALGKVHVNFSDFDLASASGHKIYAPKGVGLFYKKNGVKCQKLLYGSEDVYHPGTPALPLIVSFSKALRISLHELDKKLEIVNKWNEKILKNFSKFESIKINNSKYCIPHIINISLMDIKPETFIHALEKHEIYVSSNTACSSGKLSTSVMALYNDKVRAETTIRISISCLTKLEEITVFLNAFNGVYDKLHSLNN